MDKSPADTHSKFDSKSLEAMSQSGLTHSLAQSGSFDSANYLSRKRSGSWLRKSSCERRLSLELFKSGKRDTKLTPFYLRWSFGNNNTIPAINLSTENRKLVFYVSAHAAVLYDYETREMRLLQGHQNPINSISADEKGRWVVTSDAGDDNAVIIWDTANCVPINSLFNPHGLHCPQKAEISPNSKYLITVGDENSPVIKFWMWTFGREEADQEYVVEGNCGKLKAIKFNPDCQEHILFTFENQILFAEWKDNSLTMHSPDVKLKGNGKLTDTTFISQCHNVISVTSAGRAIIFGITIYNCPFEEAEMSIKKHYIKTIKLQEDCINVIKSVDGVVVTGDVKGIIKFYDSTMRLLYWLQNFALDSILGISFNSNKRNFKIGDPLNFDEDCEADKVSDDYHLTDEEEYETLYVQNVPSDASLHRRPFVVRDFIVLTATGYVGKVNFLENTCEFLTDFAEARITAMTTHPDKNALVICNANGRLQSYNIQSHDIQANYTLPNIAGCAESGEKLPPIEITSIAFSSGGYHLACGMSNGALWILDVSTLVNKSEHPFTISENAILKICFSHDSEYMAHYDVNMRVCLYHYDLHVQEWSPIAKIKSHYKPIRDMIFSVSSKKDSGYPALYSIGEDRRLIEYDIKSSMAKGEMVLSLAERVEQSAIPYCFIWENSKAQDTNNFFLVADNQYKYKIWNSSTAMTHRTMLGPTFGSPIQMMKMLPEITPPSSNTEKGYLIFATTRNIGIQMMPPDGNPYRYVGMIGHPTKLSHFAVSYDGKYLFTLGEGDTCVLKWQINLRAVHVMARIGGEGLDPYYCLIDGGQNGWLFNEMKDLFYYMQILHQGENTAAPREVSTKIAVGELPDLMRAVGFYPSEYEIENMIIDVKYRNFNESTELITEIEFEEFVKLYINHRSAFGINLESVKESFDVFASHYEQDDSTITREEFLDVMCYTGECCTPENVKRYLNILLHHQDEFEDVEGELPTFTFIPEVISYSSFLEDILGIRINKPHSQVFSNLSNTSK